MCLAIFKPAGKSIPAEHIKNGWQRNPGGAGFAYIKSGKIQTQKGFMTLNEFESAYYQAAKRNKKSPFLIHFRIPTMGSRNEENTHPYTFEHGVGIHNGTLHGTGAVYGVGDSDTKKFFDLFGKQMTFDNVTKLKDKLEAALGHNKFVLLYPDGRRIILRESDGFWHDDVWYSTMAFKSFRTP